MFGKRKLADDVASLESEYEILGELGRGAVSIVYLARDRELDREVAIKIIRDQYLGDAEAAARFEREARTLARLHHPNIVALHTSRRIAGGALALVMQLTRGRTLRSALREHGVFPYDRAEQILCDIADALAYLHQNDILHRDVKPENIFLDHETGRAMLSDFGIAKSREDQSNLTIAGVVLGTPAYMSPEQIDGLELDARSDIYSLGLVGYELLSGAQPWQGEDVYAVLYKQKNAQLPALRFVRPDAPEHVCIAIERAFAKKRASRWASAIEFRDQLRAPSARSPAVPAATTSTQPSAGTSGTGGGSTATTPASSGAAPSYSLWGGSAPAQDWNTPPPPLIPAAPPMAKHPSASNGPPAETETERIRVPEREGVHGKALLIAFGAFVLGAGLVVLPLARQSGAGFSGMELLDVGVGSAPAEEQSSGDLADTEDATVPADEAVADPESGSDAAALLAEEVRQLRLRLQELEQRNTGAREAAQTEPGDTLPVGTVDSLQELLREITPHVASGRRSERAIPIPEIRELPPRR